MGVEFVRLIRSSRGLPRIAVADVGAVLRDRRAEILEGDSRARSRTDTPFARVFVAYLIPFALLSRLWSTKHPVAPSQLFAGTRTSGESYELWQLCGNLVSAHRVLRRIMRGHFFRQTFRDVHRVVAGATAAADIAGVLRQGEMTFRSGSIAYLMPAASSIEPRLKRLVSDWREVQKERPIVGALVAALHTSLLHPFVDGNGRAMRAFSATAANGEIDALCNTIASFLQGRQRLWNFVLPLAVDGDSRAFWYHLETSLEHARALREAVEDLAARYRDRSGLGEADLRGPFDAALVGSAVLDDRTYRFLVARASMCVAASMRDNYLPVNDATRSTRWINSGANAIADGLTGLNRPGFRRHQSAINYGNDGGVCEREALHR